MPAKRIHDWPALREEHDKKQPGLTRQQFAELKRIQYTMLSREFHKLDVAEEERSKRSVRRILAQAAPDAAKGLARVANDIESDGNLAVKAQVAILDRIGFTPQAANLQATQVNIQVNVPPLFANESAKDRMQALLTGEVIDQTPDE